MYNMITLIEGKKKRLINPNIMQMYFNYALGEDVCMLISSKDILYENLIDSNLFMHKMIVGVGVRGRIIFDRVSR